MKKYRLSSLHGALVPVLATLVFSLIAIACGRKDSFSLKGNIDGAADKPLLVERADYNGQWIVVDSTRTNDDGTFNMDVAAAGVPEIYRLNFDGRFVYFPVDSVESVEIKSTAKDFGFKYSIEGSEQARSFAEFDHEVINISKATPDSLARFKRKCFEKYIRNAQGSILSYYILTKVVDGTPVFDGSVTADAGYITAVATSFKTYKPEDPRTKVLEQMAISVLRKRNKEQGKKMVVNANELKVIDIELPGIDGNNSRLSDIVGKGAPCVVAFTSIKDSANPQIMMRLKEMVENRGGNLKIYNVNVDGDRYAWRDAARNLPWTSVYATSAADGKVLQSYNVGAVPTFFIYSAAGELVNRAENLDALNAML